MTDRLASPCVNANSGNANWNLFIVTPPGYVTNNNLWNSNNGSNSNTYGVRPADSKKTVVVISFRYYKRRFRIRNKLCPLVVEKIHNYKIKIDKYIR